MGRWLVLSKLRVGSVGVGESRERESSSEQTTLDRIQFTTTSFVVSHSFEHRGFSCYCQPGIQHPASASSIRHPLGYKTRRDLCLAGSCRNKAAWYILSQYSLQIGRQVALIVHLQLQWTASCLGKSQTGSTNPSAVLVALPVRSLLQPHPSPSSPELSPWMLRYGRRFFDALVPWFAVRRGDGRETCEVERHSVKRREKTRRLPHSLAGRQLAGLLLPARREARQEEMDAGCRMLDARLAVARETCFLILFP